MAPTREQSLRALESARAAQRAKREAAKRGDSRPVDEPVVDPGAASAAAAAAPAEPGDRPASGRPAGTGAKPAGKAQSPSLDLSSLAGIVAALHQIQAMRTGHPHWVLSGDDRKQLGKAISDVLRWYSVKTTQKAIDHFALAMMLLEFETPRIYETRRLNALAAEIAAGRAPPRAPGAAPPAGPAVEPMNVFRFNRRPPTSAPPVEIPIGEGQ